MNNGTKVKSVVLCLLLSCYMGLSIDMILPSLAKMATYYKIESSTAQLVIGEFILTFAIMQLIHGSLLDYIGGKKLLLSSLAIYTISSFACALSYDFLFLLGFRIIQAFGAACALVFAYSFTREEFGLNTYKKIISYISISRSTFPIFFALIGGFVSQHYGWRSLFILSSVLGALIFIYAIRVPCFIQRKAESFSCSLIFRDYKKIVLNASFATYTFLGVVELSILLTYLSALPFLLTPFNNITSSSVGIFIGLNSIFLVIGSSITSFFIVRISENKIIIFGLAILLFSSLMLIFFKKNSFINPSIILSSLYVTSIGLGVCGPASFSMMLKPFKSLSGQATALSGFIRFGMASIISNILLQFSEITYALSLAILILTLVSILVLWKMTHSLGDNYGRYSTSKTGNS